MLFLRLQHLPANGSLVEKNRLLKAILLSSAIRRYVALMCSTHPCHNNRSFLRAFRFCMNGRHGYQATSTAASFRPSRYRYGKNDYQAHRIAASSQLLRYTYGKSDYKAILIATSSGRSRHIYMEGTITKQLQLRLP